METSTTFAAPYAMLRYPVQVNIYPSFCKDLLPSAENASLDVSAAQNSHLQSAYTKLAEARIECSRRPLKIGSLRPAIVLYDEIHPEGDSIGAIQTSDLGKRPDLLIIMGTSLKVFGLKKLVKDFAKAVHVSPIKNGLGGGKVIFVNLTKPSGSEWDNIIDYHICGPTDLWVSKVEQDWRRMRPADWELQSTLLQTNDGIRVQKHSSTGKGRLCLFNVALSPVKHASLTYQIRNKTRKMFLLQRHLIRRPRDG